MPNNSGSLGSAEDVGRLARGVAGVQRHDDRARVADGQAGDHPVPGVRGPDGDAVARVHAEVDHRRGGLPHFGPELGEGQRLVGRDDRVVVGELLGDAVDNARNGATWRLHCRSL